MAAGQEREEKKDGSYPCSDCNYIPVSQKDDAVRILPVLAAFGIASANDADISLMSKAFNDQKITAHHAIIPTGIQPEKLTEIEQRIYGFIAKRYVLQFFPAHEYKKITFTLAVADEQRQNKVGDASVVDTVVRRAVEPGNNFYTVPATKVVDHLFLMIGLLVFYVVYTMWYGFAIFEIFDGIGLTMTKSKVKQEG